MNATPVGGAAGATDEDFILIRDVKSSGTSGGTSSTGFATRDLNTIVHDDGGHASIASNQITLAAGTYRFYAFAPTFRTGFSRLRLRNITDGVTLDEEGTNQNVNSANNVGNNLLVIGKFIIAATKVLELQETTTSGATTNGYGVAMSLGTNEVYSQIKFLKEA